MNDSDKTKEQLIQELRELRERLAVLETPVAPLTSPESPPQINQQEFKAVFESSIDALCVSRMGTQIAVNPAYIQMFGYNSADELIGTSIFNLVAPNERNRLAEYIHRRPRGEPTPNVYETIGLRKDGSQFNMEVHVSTYESEGGMNTISILRDVTDRNLVQETLYFIAQQVWIANSTQLFSSLVQFLAEELHIACAFIGRLSEAKDSVEVVSIYQDGKIVDNFTYGLAHTPCENVIGNQLCCYPYGVQQLFPDDHLLQEMGVQGYMGTPLWDSKAEPLGIIVLLDTKPLEKLSLAESVLQIVGNRAANELERKRIEDALHRRDVLLQTVSSVAQRLLRTTNLQHAIDETLALLAKAAAVDRLCVWQNYTDHQGVLRSRPRHEWAAPGVPCYGDDPNFKDMDLIQRGFGTLIDQWQRGELTQHLEANPPAVSTDQTIQNISWLVVPILIDGELWGVTSFDMVQERREWSQIEVEALQTAGGIISAAIQHQQTLEALHESEARHRTLFENSPISLWEQDFSAVKAYIDKLQAEGVTDFSSYFTQHPEALEQCMAKVKMLDFNQATLLLYGAESKDQLRMELGTYLPPEGLAKFQENLVRFINGDTHFETENVNQTLTGKPLHCVVSVSIAPKYEETWGKVIVSIIDINERKRMEQELRKSEFNLRRAQEIAQLGSYSWNLQTGQSEWSDTLKTLLGCEDEEPSFDLALSRIHPDDREATRAKGEYCRKHHLPFNAEYRVLRPDGTIRYVRDIAEVEYDSNGNALRMFGTSLDITAEKRIEEALRQSEETARVLLNAPNDSMILLDRIGTILALNERSVHSYEQPVKQLIGGSVWDLLPSALAQLRKSKVEQVFQTGEPNYWEDQTDKKIFANATYPVFDGDGNVECVAIVVQDITERKRMEEEARTTAVLRAELAKEKEILALKERFVTMVSHEFRTPLAIMQTSSDLLSRYFEKLPEARRATLLGQIQKQIVILTNMVEDTLVLGRTQAGKIRFDPEPVKLEQFCHAIFNQIQFTDAAEHQFEFISNMANRLVAIDTKLLHHVIANLLMNAVKYSPEQSLITFQLDNDDENVYLIVHDEGIGVPKEDHARLFEPFHRASNVDNIEGTGLGLAITKEYVELHGGTIHLESELGVGTTFTVALPMT